MSFNQRQRIALARTLYGDPVLVVLDEPNSNLDDIGEQALVRAVLDLKAQGSTVVLITHRTNIVGVVDQLLVLRDGSLQLFGPRNDVLAALTKAAQAAQPALAQTGGSMSVRNWWERLTDVPAVDDENRAKSEVLKPKSDISRTVCFGSLLLLAGLLGFLLWAVLAPLDAGVPAPGGSHADCRLPCPRRHKQVKR